METIKVSVLLAKYRRVSDGQTSFVLEIDDESSGVRILTISLTNEDVCSAVIGNSECKAQAEFTRHRSLIGSKREIKSVPVTVDRENEPKRRTDAWKDWADEQCEPYEIDGWRARSPARVFDNHHKRVAGEPDTYSVIFDRYLDAQGRPLRH